MYKRPLSDIKYLVIHHTATPESFSVDDIRKIHVEGPESMSDIGYHFLTNKTGLKVGRPAIYNGGHAFGEKTHENINHKALGLAIIGSYESHNASDKVINETCYAIKRICVKYKIPLDRNYVFGHHRVDYTACPGKNTMHLIYKKLGI